MKTRWKHLISGFTMFVLCISVCTTTANAAVVWQDDFSDPNLPGWTIYGYTYDGYGHYPVPREGNISAADGTLKALDDYANIARHESDVSVGTWSFDMFVPDDDDGVGNMYVEFLSNGSSFIEFGNASFIAVGAYLDDDKFVVWSIVESNWAVLKNILIDPLEGWHHIDVSRNSDGRFLVAFNGTLEANFTSDRVTSSTYLQFTCNHATGAAIDNLVVDNDPDKILDNIDWTTPTPTPTTPPPESTLWILIAVGGGVAVAVIVLAIVILRRR